MILTVKQGDDQIQLKAPVFIIERQEFGVVSSGSVVSFVPMPADRDAFLKENDHGYIILGGTSTAVENTITIAPVWDGQIPAALRKVNTINGVGANDSGEFFIDGSECDSWGYIENGYARPMNEEIKGRTAGMSGIWITDLCPACSSCETIYRLKYEVENLKLWLNTLKDVNLYWSQIYDQRTDYVEQRRNLLNSCRITGGTENQACNAGLQADDAYMQLKGVQLLQQYLTVVHMWNYVVSRNNSSTLITIAPEDTTGFVVQTKRALTSCADAQAIRCVIDVQPVGIFRDGNSITPEDFPSDYPISIFVPDRSNEILFEPFDNDSYQDIALHGINKMTIRTYPASGFNNQPVAHKQADTSPTLAPDYINAKIAGTYVITTKFLPFIYYRAWRGFKPNGTPDYISMRGGKHGSDVKPYPVGDDGTVVYNFGISGCTSSPLASPTETNYLDAKTAPTCSVPFKILWDITITWEIQGEEPDIENYRYMANGIRAYYDKATIMSNTEVTPIEPDEPDTGE